MFFLPFLAMAAGSALAAKVGKQKAPKAAKFDPVDPQEEQRKAMSGNLESADDIEALLSRANSFTQDQASGLMEKAVPGYSKIAGKFMEQADGLLTNPYGVPDDVSTNLTRLAAERGINTGARGQVNDFSLLRDFGINSLQYGGQRISQAQSIVQTIANLAPRVNPMSPMSFYITPGQQIATADANNRTKFGAEQSQNNAEMAAKNANATMWSGLVANLAGMGAGAIASRVPAAGATGAGTMAATPRVDEDWRFQ